MDTAYPVIRAVPMHSQPKIFALVKMTLSDLGLGDYATLSEILELHGSRGLRECPPEVALALFEAYNDQPENEHLEVCMAPIYVDHGSGGKHKGQYEHHFSLGGNIRGRYLTCSYGGKGCGHLYSEKETLLFCMEKK